MFLGNDWFGYNSLKWCLESRGFKSSAEIDKTSYEWFVDVRNQQFRRKCLAGRVGDKRSDNTEESSSFKYLVIAVATWCEKYLFIWPQQEQLKNKRRRRCQDIWYLMDIDIQFTSFMICIE